MPRISLPDRRDALVAAAVRVAARDGVHAATTRAIVSEAGMSLASFHYAFRSRDEMMRYLIAAVVDTESRAALESMRDSRDIRSSLRIGLQAYFDVVRADPTHEQVLMELIHHSLRTPELDDLPRRVYASYHTAVAALLATASERAGIEWSRPVTEVARAIVTVTDGVTLAWLSDRDDAAAERVLDFAADSLAALTIEREPEPRENEPREPDPREPVPREKEPREPEPRENDRRQNDPRETQPRQTDPRETQPRQTDPRETQPRATRQRGTQR